MSSVILRDDGTVDATALLQIVPGVGPVFDFVQGDDWLVVYRFQDVLTAAEPTPYIWHWGDEAWQKLTIH